MWWKVLTAAILGCISGMCIMHKRDMADIEYALSAVRKAEVLVKEQQQLNEEILTGVEQMMKETLSMATASEPCINAINRLHAMLNNIGE